MQQHVLLAHHVQQRAVFAQQLRGAGAMRGEFEVGAIHHIGHGHQPHQVNRALYAVKLGAAELELAKQEVIHMLWAVVGHFQAHGAAVLAVAQLAHNGGAQVFNVFFVYAQIAVAGEAELVAAFDGHAGEQGMHMGMQNGRQKHKAVVAVAQRRRQFEYARQNARCLHNRHAAGAAKGVFAFQLYYEIERFIQQPRERMRRIQADGGENGQQLAAEIIGHPLLLRFAPGAARIKINPFFTQRRNQLLIKQAVLLADDVVRLGGYMVDNGGGQLAIGQGGMRLQHARAPQPGHAHLKKFIQIRRHNAQKTQAL